MKHKISIAMTTYNGEAYILEQLNSILYQTIVPDEVIICDDRSTDKTYEIVENYIKQHKLLGWKLKRNDANLGWQSNFYQAIGMTTGDIIFCSDQDDIWLEDKIETMVSCMDKEDIGCLYGKRHIINEHGELVDFANVSGDLKKIAFDKSFSGKVVLGCCMCFRKEIADKYLEINCPENGHDSQCARIALLFSSLWELDQPVIKYRIHGGNTSGISAERSYGKSNLDKRIMELYHTRGWLEKVLTIYKFTDEKLKLLLESVKVLQKREEYLRKEKGIHWISLTKYIKYYTGFSMLLGDFAYRNRLNNIMGIMRQWISRK